MVKTLKNLLLMNWRADFQETCYVASRTPAHYSFVKMMPLSYFDLFYGKVKFGNLAFSIGKSENTGFFSETIAASDLKGTRSRHLIKYMKICGIEGQGHFLTLAHGRVHTKIQTGFSQKLLSDLNQILYESFQV